MEIEEIKLKIKECKRLKDEHKDLCNSLEKHYRDLKIFDKVQLGLIYSGIWNGLDVTEYANPEFNHGQMTELKKGIHNGSYYKNNIYNNVKYNDQQMREIRLGIEEGLSDDEINLYSNSKFNDNKMKLIREGLFRKIDVKLYAKPEYSRDFMLSIFNILIEETISHEEKMTKINLLIMEN